GTRSAKFSGYTLVAEQPVVEVVGGWPEVLRVFAPTIAGVGEDVCLKIVARDCYENTALVQPEMLELDGGPAVRAEVLPPKGPLMATRQAEGRSSARALDSFSGPGDVPLPTRTLPAVPRLASVRAAFPGTYRVEVAAPEMGLTGLSNPMVIEDRSDGLQLYWGDPHGHTRLSDGLGTPEAYFAFARDEAALDFAAIADHAQYMSDEDWEWIRSAVAAFNRPGEFVTILGYEYSLNADKPHFGDKCIYYPGENGPLLRETDIYRTEYADMAAHAVEWKRHGAMMVLHQHARGTCSFYDPDLVRLVEVYSVWGASEGPEATRDLLPSRVRDYSGHWARDALELGWILGFCAGSDDHAGRPGASNWLRRSEAWPGGLTAVWATELTREAIWDALWNRRCYGTTGARIFLEFTAAG
ncbi:MAG: DUF3604 domain-containing protein, partial [Armatimonadetes bacterium]|nr:DUF3604 domain-containing protein [Armatimonadota bacterium]